MTERGSEVVRPPRSPALLIGRAREFCRTRPNQREVSVKGIHYIQEDAPIEVGQALPDWVRAEA